MRKQIEKGNSGITLIALVVTIIVLLILAGISIGMLSGNNGILKKSREAKNDTIIGEEREQVELAYISAAVKKLGDDVTYQDLQDELDISVGTNKTKVTINANNTLNVLFKDTDHNYNVNDGKVEKVEDEGTQVSSIDESATILSALDGANEDDIWLNSSITIGEETAKFYDYNHATSKEYIEYRGSIYMITYDTDWNVGRVEKTDINVASLGLNGNSMNTIGCGILTIVNTETDSKIGETIYYVTDGNYNYSYNANGMLVEDPEEVDNGK